MHSLAFGFFAWYERPFSPKNKPKARNLSVFPKMLPIFTLYRKNF